MSIFIETPRLIIRELEQNDAEAMFEMDSDPEVHKYVGRNPTKTVAFTRTVIDSVRQQYQDNGIGRWAVIEKATNTFIGWTGFKLMTEPVNGHINIHDFGYRFRKSKWGQGIGYESGLAALRYGVETIGLKDVYAMTDPDNIGSRRLLEKLGFRYVEDFLYDGPGGWRDEGEMATWYQLP